MTFNVRSEYVTGPVGRFTNLPQKPLLTLAMDLPESWLVEVVRSPYDLDNIYLEEVSSGVNAEFELEYLLLEGKINFVNYFSLNSGSHPDLFFLKQNNNPQKETNLLVKSSQCGFTRN